jgi:hypothetical protein
MLKDKTMIGQRYYVNTSKQQSLVVVRDERVRGEKRLNRDGIWTLESRRNLGVGA